MNLKEESLTKREWGGKKDFSHRERFRLLSELSATLASTMKRIKKTKSIAIPTDDSIKLHAKAYHRNLSITTKEDRESLIHRTVSLSIQFGGFMIRGLPAALRAIPRFPVPF